MVSVLHLLAGLALLLAAWSLRSEVEPLFAGGELADPEALRWAASGSFFNFQGHAIFYKIREAAAQAPAGTGAAKPPTIVLLHGFPTNSFDFLHLWRALPQKYRLVTLDLLSFGLSDKPEGIPIRLVDQADLVMAFLKHVNITEAHLLVHDYSVSVAQELLARFHAGDASVPQLQSVLFLNGGIIPDMHRPLLMQWLLAAPLVGPLLTKVAIGEFTFKRSFSGVFGVKPTATELHTYWSFVRHKQGHRLAHAQLQYMRERRANLYRWVGTLLYPADKPRFVPALFVNGPADPISGAHVMEALRELRPSSNITMLAAHIGHYPQVEASKEVLKAYIPWLEELL
jgi:pimeloyl-ACP methyl ester carboxylesterase